MSQGVYDFGEEATAATLVKLTGNFMIQAALEAMSEGLALAEKHGLDQKAGNGYAVRYYFCLPALQKLWKKDCRKTL
jgi:3-hydroxyisobutyrate dehydrogenase-like beta-hydroxyacid dehydrogenase